MTCEKFIEIVKRMRDIEDRITQADKLLGSELFEGVLGEYFDIITDALLPGAKDWVIEDFGNLLFEPDVSDIEIEDFWYMYKESLA